MSITNNKPIRAGSYEKELIFNIKHWILI